MKLETQLKHLLIELDELHEKYRDMKHQDRDRECELIYQGKSEAYAYVGHKLEGILKWHGIVGASGQTGT